MRIEEQVEGRMRDGTVLRADVYRPDGSGSWPALLLRLPYDKTTRHYRETFAEVERLTVAGYVVVIQDVRGRFASEGEFYPFIYEAEDGYDSVEWAARLPEVNGRVGMIGMSYHGFTQVAAAAGQPPSLVAIAPMMAFADGWSTMRGDRGVFEIGKWQTWVAESMLPDHLERLEDPEGPDRISRYLKDLPAWLGKGNPLTWPPVTAAGLPSYYNDFLLGNVSEETRERMQVNPESIKVPALFLAGWYDCFLEETIDLYQRTAGPVELWIGPWTHEDQSGQAGDVFFPDAQVDRTALFLQWFDRWLRDEKAPPRNPVHYYVMNAGKWRSGTKIPEGNSETVFYMHSDGLLFGDAPEQASSIRIEHDPDYPVPTIGGNILMSGFPAGSFDQQEVQARSDVLVYTSAPLQENWEMLGTAQARLWMNASRPELPIGLRISEVQPDGSAWNVMDSLEGQPEAAGKRVIDIGRTAYWFSAGSRLRVEIYLSSFPRIENGTSPAWAEIQGSSQLHVIAGTLPVFTN
ncbi:CocE/NonD family hydrolase [Marinococcus luteus]|uniref:CocE/NonD family hydrolase n=1 Tax=Marinococcus luteus TaxID=1122204 RepID=UPI002ACC9B31|nr:CocE/NonD family hydrolase [Marinococcus luteus]MDZ5784186.1 CocE/NonD family hydrolase [Marinococcus luteus]